MNTPVIYVKAPGVYTCTVTYKDVNGVVMSKQTSETITVQMSLGKYR